MFIFLSGSEIEN